MNSLRRLIASYVDFSHCKVVLPWFAFANGNDPSSRLHRLALELESGPRAHGLRHQLIATVWHLPIQLRQVLIAYKNGCRTLRARHGIGYLTQAVDLLVWVFRFNHPAHAYYCQQVALRRNRREWIHYFHQWEHELIIRSQTVGKSPERCSDKLRLFRALRAHGVPTIDILLAARDGAWESDPYCGLNSRLLLRDLIVKPTNDYIDNGVQHWRFDPATRTHSLVAKAAKNLDDRFPPDRRVSLPELLEHVLECSLNKPQIVQPWMRNAPALEAIAAPDEVVNFRIVTVVVGGRPQIAAMVARIPFDLLRWNYAAYAARVGRDSGELGVATGRSEFLGYGERHFNTGARITGFQVPHWRVIKAMAIRAHRLFPEIPTVGWDILATDDGVRVMEGNVIWGCDNCQLAGYFLGDTAYAQACLEALRDPVADPDPEPDPAAVAVSASVTA